MWFIVLTLAFSNGAPSQHMFVKEQFTQEQCQEKLRTINEQLAAEQPPIPDLAGITARCIQKPEDAQ